MRSVAACATACSAARRQDWDICTSAAPEQTEACFAADRTVLTGVRYGTVTVVRGGVPYEITTFRAESGYADSRHPDRVDFLRELAPDLARRDFTVNAMAADAAGAVTDLFGGQDDLRRGVIRCVGDPVARFSEDALRMLRALRFAAPAVLPHRRRDGCRHPCCPDPAARRCAGAPAQGA